MGCGQSKIGNIYPKNKKNKNNNGKKNGDSVGSASVEQKNGNGNAKNNKTNNNGVEVNRNEEQNGSGEIKGQAKKKSNAPGSGPLLQQAEISTSQLDFFKMLDEKIENGPDYDESLDTTARAERVSSLLRQWELASVTWSSVSDLNSTSLSCTTKNRNSGLNLSRQSLTAKDREGMRNIVGGRPESAPIYVRNANRVDGLQETHCPSPNMPRHVLESITQSPTQSLKNVTPPGSSPTSLMRYHQDSYKDSCNANHPSAKTVNVHYAATQNPINGEYVSQQALYREQYLQQTGIINVPSQYSTSSPGGNVLRNNPYMQQYQITNPQHFTTSRKRGFNAAQMT
ncbi:target of wingless isoform X1 [Osmia lignaria lignaria]|uniref:target of wingless isoform X1 n=1 Tax=Osmia lignaria lignaria TaxID=1437193 RepID=UPI00402BD644